MFLQNLLDAENSTKADQLLKLGGTTVLGATLNTTPQTAFVYLKLPHNSCRAVGKPLPFPSDLNTAAAAA